MRIRHVPSVVIVFVGLLIPSVASADGHRAGLFGGASVATGSTFTGAHFNVEHTLQDRDKKYIYGSADYSFHKGNDRWKQILLFGGESPFVQIGPISGGGRFRAGWVWDDGNASFAGAVGGFIDIGKYSPSVHSTSKRYELRLTFEEILVNGAAENFERYSIGLVVKWPPNKK